MKFQFLAALCGLACVLPAFAAADAAAALALASASTTVPADAPLTYAEASRRALAERKPLVVWVGDALCPGCIAKMEGETVNVVVKDFEGVPAGGGLVVGVPDGTDELLRVATITEWETGDKIWGHVPSIRRALTAWRIRGLTQRSGWSRGMDRITPPGMSPSVATDKINLMVAPPRSMMAAPRFSAPRRGG